MGTHGLAFRMGLGFGTVLLSATSTHAQEASDSKALEEIIVTAERREADVQRVGASVAVQTGSDLAQEGRYSLNQILEGIPGVAGASFTGLADTGTDVPENGISIRGIRSNGSNNNLSTVPANAVYVDGVYGGVGSNYDIERVEVLRGPQGTLYGRSATGGVIATYTVNPNLTQTEGYISAEAGSYSLQHYTGAVNVPLVDDVLAMRVSGNYYNRDGYNHPQGGEVKNEDARIKLLYRPIDDLSVLFGFALQDNETHGGGVLYRLTGQRTPGSYYPDFNTPVGNGANSFRLYWAELNWQLGGMKLTYLPSFRTWKNEGTSYVVGPGGPLLKQRVKTSDDKYNVHELRLASQGDTKFTWQVGALYWFNGVGEFINDIRWASNDVLGTYREQQRDAKDIGLFGEATYSFTNSTRLTTGLRWDKSSVTTEMDYARNTNLTGNVNDPVLRGTPVGLQTYRITGNEGKRDYTNVTYKVRLEQDLTPSNLIYAMVATGFLPGDIQIGSSVPLAVYDYKAETVTAYELGSKNRFFENRLQANVAAYFYDYGGYQTTITLNIADPTSQIVVSTPVQITGAELELLYQMTERDRVGFTYGYTRARWVNKPAQFASSVYGDDLAGIPPQTATLTWEHRIDLPGGSVINLEADARYQAGYYTNQTTPALAAIGVLPYVHLDSQTIGNANISWRSSGGRYSVTGYVRNVADQRYRTGNSIQTFTSTQLIGTVTLSDPRTWGVTVSVKL